MIHPDTGEEIFMPFRMSGFIPFGAPIVSNLHFLFILPVKLVVKLKGISRMTEGMNLLTYLFSNLYFSSVCRITPA